MPTLLELIEAKNERLESVPDALLSEMEKVQKQIYEDLIAILARFDLDSQGRFEVSKKNLDLAGQVDALLRDSFERSQYGEAVTEFAKEFNNQIDFNDEYFKAAFPEFTASEIGKQLVKNAQSNAVTLMINTSPDADFIIPIKQQIEAAIVNNASFRETLKTIQEITTGNDEIDGKIMQYSKQISHDSFAVADRSYVSAVADSVGAEWYKYSGSRIKTSRQFCIERHNRYYAKAEIAAWGAGENTDSGEFEFPQGGQWPGEFEGTNSATIFSTAGGYNCRHSIMPISIFIVPKEQIQRSIDLGFYEPTDFEIQELGL